MTSRELNLRTKRVLEFDKRSFVVFLSENYPLFCILVGAVLVSASLGPFQNIDTQLEFTAALGVVRWGMPFMRYVGDMINQPPLSFYTEAVFLKIFGLSYTTGVTSIMLIGLGSTFLVYTIGNAVYGKPTALLAAALFALTPWHLALSRSFLIDAQCLFLSLLSIYVGICAIRRDSFRFFMVSGILFAMGLLTKFFAVFALIPLTLFYVQYRQRKLSRIAAVVAYFLPAICLVILWYQIISGRGLSSIIRIDDFGNFNPAGVSPSPFFAINFLLTGLGALFLIAAALSMTASLSGRKIFAKYLPFDLICLVTIFAVASVDTFLAVGLNFNAPYNSSIKYNYQFLPFISLLASSLIGKCLLLFNSMKSKEKPSKLLFSIVAGGLVSLAVAMFLNINYVLNYSTWDHWLFKVELNQNIGYSFVNLTPAIGNYSFLIAVQYLGYAIVLSGLVLASRNKLGWLRRKIWG